MSVMWMLCVMLCVLCIKYKLLVVGFALHVVEIFLQGFNLQMTWSFPHPVDFHFGTGSFLFQNLLKSACSISFLAQSYL